MRYQHGKGNEMQVQVNFINKHHRELYRDFYCGFLNNSELELRFEGKDYWFEYKEIVKRLKLLHKHRRPEPIGISVSPSS